MRKQILKSFFRFTTTFMVCTAILTTTFFTRHGSADIAPLNDMKTQYDLHE